MQNINEQEIESGCLGSLCLLFYRLFQSVNRIQAQHFKCMRRSEALHFIKYSESSDSNNDSSTSSSRSKQHISDDKLENTKLLFSKLKNI